MAVIETLFDEFQLSQWFLEGILRGLHTELMKIPDQRTMPDNLVLIGGGETKHVTD